MGKLEETFNLPDILEEMESRAEQIIDHFDENKDENENINRMLDEFKGSMNEIELSEFADLKKFDKEMDEIASKTLQEFDDLIVIGKDVEARNAGEIFSAAAQMAKIALDARTKKTDAKLKILELSVRRKRNELLEEKQKFEMDGDPDRGQTAQVLDREDFIKIAEQLLKKKD